jgi:hypothetical protein
MVMTAVLSQTTSDERHGMEQRPLQDGSTTVHAWMRQRSEQRAIGTGIGCPEIFRDP